MSKHKSRVKWLELGDNNNSYFHRSLMARRNKNNIIHITSSDGRVLEYDEKIRNEVDFFFQNILAPKSGG